MRPQLQRRRTLWSAGLLLATACGSARPATEPGYAFESGLLNVADDPDAPDEGPELAEAPPRPPRKTQPARPQPANPPRVRPVAVSQPPEREPPVAAAPKTAPVPGPAPVPKPVMASPRPPAPTPTLSRNDDDLRATQRVEAALALLGTPGLQDRSFVAAVLRASGQNVDVERNLPYAAALHAKLQQQGGLVDEGDARPGDLVFFRDTADLNGNGRPDDGVTMVGVVERVQGARAIFVAQRAGKVRRLAVDPSRPEVVRDAGGEVANTRLVRWPGQVAALTSGQCLVGYGRP